MKLFRIKVSFVGGKKNDVIYIGDYCESIFKMFSFPIEKDKIDWYRKQIKVFGRWITIKKKS